MGNKKVKSAKFQAQGLEFYPIVKVEPLFLGPGSTIYNNSNVVPFLKSVQFCLVSFGYYESCTLK